MENRGSWPSRAEDGRRVEGGKQRAQREVTVVEKRNMDCWHDSRARWGRGRAVCVFAKLVVIRHEEVEGDLENEWCAGGETGSVRGGKKE